MLADLKIKNSENFSSKKKKSNCFTEEEIKPKQSTELLQRNFDTSSCSSLSARLLSFKHEKEFTENTVKKRQWYLENQRDKVPDISCISKQEIRPHKKVDSKHLLGKSVRYCTEISFFNTIHVPMQLWKTTKAFVALKFAENMTREKFTYTYSNTVRQNTKNPEVWKKICTKVLTVYWENGANYVQYQCKYRANTLMLKKRYTFLYLKSMELHEHSKN